MPATQEDEAGVGGVEVAGDVVVVVMAEVEVAGDVVVVVMAEVLAVMEDVAGVVALEGVVDTVDGLIRIPHQWYAYSNCIVHVT